MRLALHAIICCCLIAAVLPVPVDDAAGDASLKKRIRACLQNHGKTELDLFASRSSQKESDAAEVQQVEKEKTPSPPSSSGLNIRPRRAAKAAGCFLFACVYHNLLHRLEHFSSKQKVKTAPEKRMRPSGYGRRRRRSLEDGAPVALQTDERDSGEALPVCGYDICTVA